MVHVTRRSIRSGTYPVLLAVDRSESRAHNQAEYVACLPNAASEDVLVSAECPVTVTG